MKLHYFPHSPNCWKVRAVAWELGAELEIVPVNLLRGESRTSAFLDVNPNGRLPVLEDGDFVLWESGAILTYLAAKHTQKASLLPGDAKGRADVDRWLFWLGAHLSPAIRKVAFERVVKKLIGSGAPDQTLIDEGTREFATFAAVIDRALGGKEHLAGRLSVADFALAAHFALAGTCGLDVKAYPHLDAWLSRITSRDSMRRAFAEAQAM